VWQEYASVMSGHHTVIPSEAEESRDASLKVTSTGFLDFARNDRVVVRTGGELPFAAIACIIFLSMDYDVAIIGGAFSGAATALMLKRRCPNARVQIIEKTTEFDRKVGESTTEVSSCYMTRILGLTHHLGHHH